MPPPGHHINVPVLPLHQDQVVYADTSWGMKASRPRISLEHGKTANAEAHNSLSTGSNMPMAHKSGHLRECYFVVSAPWQKQYIIHNNAINNKLGLFCWHSKSKLLLHLRSVLWGTHQIIYALALRILLHEAIYKFETRHGPLMSRYCSFLTD